MTLSSRIEAASGPDRELDAGANPMTEPLTDLVEELARVIADALGDNYSDAFKSKDRWIAKRGMSGGRFRDVNEPFRCDYEEAARAVLESPIITREIDRAKAEGWRPIETAPKDGTAIMLAASHGVSVGWWEDNEPVFKWRFVDDFDLTPTGCCDMESEDRVPCNGMHEDAPTHWMPLPSPPSIEG